MTGQTLRPRSRGLLVLDFGSQYTLLIARRLRELGFYTEVIPATSSAPPAGFEVSGLILSGGPDSVTAALSRRLPAWALTWDLPRLGICYGMQLLVEMSGGKVREAHFREYGRTIIRAHKSPATARVALPLTPSSTVWMSHGDDIERLPEGWTALATTASGVIAAAESADGRTLVLQFHPEVAHTELGPELLRHFAAERCGLSPDWDALGMEASSIALIQNTVGEGHVLMAVSGGVDSTVAAALLVKALGPQRVTTVFVDHGLLRKNEASRVLEHLREGGINQVHLLERQSLFLNALQGVSEPEAKRKIIGRLFIEVFEEFAREHQGEFTHLGQGTLYPDVIESAAGGSGAQVIKSHHNVGGIPDTLKLKLVEPFRFMFKDEVRVLGRQLGLPPTLIDRHPFPGPGLAVRVLGEITPEKIAILQAVDDVFIRALRDSGLYSAAWQAFAVLLPVRSVGVMGDNRTWQWTAALRAVTSSDGMTAEVADLPLRFLTETASRIVREVSGINRVVYDITTKPPATIEWE